MQKRGSFRLVIEEFWTIPRVILVLILIFVIILIVSSYAHRKVDTYELENSILLNGLLYSKDCLAYEDYRVHAGVVDLNKLNENKIKECGEYSNNIGFKIELFSLDNSLIKEVLVNNDLVDAYLPSCKAEHKKLDCSSKVQYVLIRGERTIPGILKLTVVRWFG